MSELREVVAQAQSRAIRGRVRSERHRHRYPAGTQRARSRTARPFPGQSPSALEGRRRARGRSGKSAAGIARTGCVRGRASPGARCCSATWSVRRRYQTRSIPNCSAALIRRYQDAAAGAIGRFGGFVAKFMGDGVLAYFGFPRAFEDAAERAVRAAINILAEVGGIELPDGSRVGPGSGSRPVWSWSARSSASAPRRSVPSSATRLISPRGFRRSPSPTRFSSARRRRVLLGGLFHLGIHRHARELKGFAHPVAAWRVLGEAAVESRFAAIRTGTLPLVGRAHEMGLMLERWRLARSGEGQIVSVVGEAGIGKSRAIEALQEDVAHEPHTRIHLQRSPYHRDSALYPVIQHLSRAAGFAPADFADARIDKLRVMFARRAASDETAVPLLAELLSIPGRGPRWRACRSLRRTARRRPSHRAACRRDRPFGRERSGLAGAGGRALDRSHDARIDDALGRQP